MLFFGLKFRKKAPNRINWYYGYRTTMSMKNQETWEFAHLYFGRLWRRWSVLILIPSLIVCLATLRISEDVREMVILVSVTVQTILLVISIYPVEKALKSNFDQDGN
jgi:uncharacterized membrane protein